MIFGTIQEHQVSALIPALNAGASLPRLLRQLAASRCVRQIVVADGGSTDDTARSARAAGASVIQTPRGRGTQLAAGARVATAAWLLFLHADCELVDGWETAVRRFMETRPGAAGYFDLRLDTTSAAARRLEKIVSWRCRAIALPYGDQGLLISRALYEEVGGFAAIPLMEDVNLIRRLGRRRVAPLEHPIRASAARYERDGYVVRPLRNLFCLSLYFAGMAPERIARLYD